MPVPTANGVPCSFAAGDTVIFTEAFSGFLSPAWTLDFILSRAGQNLLTSRATQSGAGFLVTLATVDTSAIQPGSATYTELLTEVSTGQRRTACGGKLTIFPNPSLSLQLSPAQVSLAAARAKMLELLSGFQSTSFNGQSFTSANLGELQKIIDRLQATVDAELRALGLSDAGGAHTIQFSFRR